MFEHQSAFASVRGGATCVSGFHTGVMARRIQRIDKFFNFSKIFLFRQEQYSDCISICTFSFSSTAIPSFCFGVFPFPSARTISFCVSTEKPPSYPGMDIQRDSLRTSQMQNRAVYSCQSKLCCSEPSHCVVNSVFVL